MVILTNDWRFFNKRFSPIIGFYISDWRFFCERIEQCALNKALKLTGGSLQVLFYDATTLYFESFTEDELKQDGYSKDMKFNQPQVLLALLVTES